MSSMLYPSGKDSTKFGKFYVSAKSECVEDTCCADKLEDCCIISKRLSTGSIIAIGFGAAALLVLILVYFFILQSRKRSTGSGENVKSTSSDPTSLKPAVAVDNEDPTSQTEAQSMQDGETVMQPA